MVCTYISKCIRVYRLYINLSGWCWAGGVKNVSFKNLRVTISRINAVFSIEQCPVSAPDFLSTSTSLIPLTSVSQSSFCLLNMVNSSSSLSSRVSAQWRDFLVEFQNSFVCFYKVNSGGGDKPIWDWNLQGYNRIELPRWLAGPGSDISEGGREENPAKDIAHVETLQFIQFVKFVETTELSMVINLMMMTEGIKQEQKTFIL